MALRFYERRDWLDPKILKLWADPEDYDQAAMQEYLSRLETLAALDDETLLILANDQAGIGNVRDVLQAEIDRYKDILDFFDYEKTPQTFQTADGTWFTPEAVEAVCGEDVDQGADLILDADHNTYWQHSVDEEHQIDFRVRSYLKKMTKVRFRRFSNERTELNNLTISAAWTLGALDNPSNVVATGATLSTVADWNEVEFTSPKRAKYLRLSGFGSAHASNHARIRTVEVWVTVHEYK